MTGWLAAMSSADFDTVRNAVAGAINAYGLRALSAEEALDRIQAENERLRLRDKMRDDGEHHLLGEIEARDKEIERLREALREIAISPISPRDVEIARAALGEQP